MKKRNRILSLLLAGVMALGLTACGASNAGAAADETGSAAVSTESASSDTAASGEKIINVGVTNTIGSINPLLLNGGEINKYATGLMFLPLMELDADLNFEGMLADSITTEDNKNLSFTSMMLQPGRTERLLQQMMWFIPRFAWRARSSAILQ